MANNSIWNETKVTWADPNRERHIGCSVMVKTGKVVAQSRLGDEQVIVEWDAQGFPVTIEHVDDLIEIK